MNRAEFTALQHNRRYRRIERLLTKPCPFCKAEIGEPCRSAAGNHIFSIGQMHNARLSSDGGRWVRFK
jgi:hypothetical protein